MDETQPPSTSPTGYWLPGSPVPQKPQLSHWVRFWCNVMGWHPTRTREFLSFDGCSAEMRCGRCGFVGLVDSQGNLF